MNIERHVRRFGLGVLCLALLLPAAGCFSLRNPFGVRGQASGKGLEVVAIANQQALQLAPIDVANILLGVGFTRDESYAIGIDLAQALMQRGMARIRRGDQWIAQLRVAGERVQIMVTNRGYFEYDVKTHRFVLGPSTQQPQVPTVPAPTAPPAQPTTPTPYVQPGTVPVY